VPTPSTRQRLGSPGQSGLQLPATYALAAENPTTLRDRPLCSAGRKLK